MSKHFFPGDSCPMRSRSPSWDEPGPSTSHASLKVSGKCYVSEPSRHAPPRPLPGDWGQAAWSGDGQAQRTRFEPSEKPAELGAAGERTTSSHKPLQPGYPDTRTPGHPRLRVWMGRVRGVRAGETTHVLKTDPRLGAPNQLRRCSHWDSSKFHVQKSFYIQQSRLVQLNDPFHWEIPVSHQSVQSMHSDTSWELSPGPGASITPGRYTQRLPSESSMSVPDTNQEMSYSWKKGTRDTRGSDAWHLEGREEQVREDSLGRADENWTWKDPAAWPAWMKAAAGEHGRCRLQRTPCCSWSTREAPTSRAMSPSPALVHSGTSSLPGPSVGERSRMSSL